MFSKSCKYAMRAVLYLAEHSSKEKKLMVSDIAENLEVPRHFLAKILQQLSRQKLITSLKGPSGGFYMTDENLNSPLMAIVVCFDGPEVFSSCVLGLPECSEEYPCPLHANMQKFRAGFEKLLLEKSIENVSKQVFEQNLRI